MSGSLRKQWPFFLATVLMVLGIGWAIWISRSQQYDPKAAHIAHFVVHLPYKCHMRGWLLLNGHESMNFDAGDETQQKLWALAKECGGRIELEKPSKNDYVFPKGPDRNG